LGKQGSDHGRADAQSLRDALPNAQVKIFDGLGHNPFWEDPAGVAQVINAFLEAKT
jgi:pimeloyl-ACP methyl ester carboxylesterase